MQRKETWWSEYWFHPIRKWRFDFACPEHKLAIEIHGGIFVRGRHINPMGFIRDAEKTRVAICHGWRVMPYVPYGKNWLDLIVIDLSILLPPCHTVP